MDAFFRAGDQEEASASLVFQAEGLVEASAFPDFRRVEGSDHQARHQVDRAADLDLQDLRVVEEALEDRMDRHRLRRQTSPLKCSRSARSLLILVPLEAAYSAIPMYGCKTETASGSTRPLSAGPLLPAGAGETGAGRITEQT